MLQKRGAGLFYELIELPLSFYIDGQDDAALFHWRYLNYFDGGHELHAYSRCRFITASSARHFRLIDDEA